MMKKHLFTLLFVVIAMAGQASAENCLYIDDVVLNPNQAGSLITIPVKASFNSHVSAWDISFVFPEGMRPVGNDTYSSYIAGPGLAVPYYYYNYRRNEWREETANARLQNHFDGQSVRLITSPFMVMGYEYNPDYDPDYDDELESYGSVKWSPGEYLMFTLKVEVDDYFIGGEIEVTSTTTCGWDSRFGNIHQIEDSTAYPIPYPYEYEDSTYYGYIYPGEVNGDGTVSIADVTALINVILGTEDYYEPEVCDMDANGVIDLTDVIILSDYLILGYPMYNGYRMVGYELQTVESAVTARVLIMGDLSGDGTISISDVTLLIDALLMEQSPDAGDFNGDGVISIADVTALIDYLLMM